MHLLMLAAAAALAVLILDQVSKAIVIRRLARAEWRVGRWLRLRLVINANRRAGWWRAASAAVFLAVLLATSWLIAGGASAMHAAVATGLGAGAGGAAGNQYDRLRRGGVVDFIDLGWWPVFNLADAGIVGGAIAVVVFL